MTAIKLDLSESLRWREAVPQCAEYLEKHKDKSFEKQAEIVILNLLQVLGGHIVEEEIGQPVLAMGDGLYMPRSEANRLSKMVSDCEQAQGIEAQRAETAKTGSVRSTKARSRSDAPKGQQEGPEGSVR